MSKSILVIDTPECCAECPLSDDCAEICGAIDKLIAEVNGECEKPDWCPITELPQKMADENRWFSEDYAKGRNACIDEILKGVNGNDEGTV